MPPVGRSEMWRRQGEAAFTPKRLISAAWTADQKRRWQQVQLALWRSPGTIPGFHLWMSRARFRVDRERRCERWV